MAAADKRKQSLYFDERALEEVRLEAARLDRSLSWVVQKAWKLARKQVLAMPSANAAPLADAPLANSGGDTEPSAE